MRVIIEASWVWYCVVVSNLFSAYFRFLFHLRNMKCQTNGTSFVPVAFPCSFYIKASTLLDRILTSNKSNLFFHEQ